VNGVSLCTLLYHNDISIARVITLDGSPAIDWYGPWYGSGNNWASASKGFSEPSGVVVRVVAPLRSPTIVCREASLSMLASPSPWDSLRAGLDRDPPLPFMGDYERVGEYCAVLGQLGGGASYTTPQ